MRSCAITGIRRGWVRHDRVVDDHVRRVTAALRRALDEYDQGRGSVEAVQEAAVGAAGALDNSNADLRRKLERLDADLEVIRVATPESAESEAMRNATAAIRSVLSDID